MRIVVMCFQVGSSFIIRIAYLKCGALADVKGKTRHKTKSILQTVRYPRPDVLVPINHCVQIKGCSSCITFNAYRGYDLAATPEVKIISDSQVIMACGTIIQLR